MTSGCSGTTAPLGVKTSWSDPTSASPHGRPPHGHVGPRAQGMDAVPLGHAPGAAGLCAGVRVRGLSPARLQGGGGRGKALRFARANALGQVAALHFG
jgi:hypothetical protein